MFIVRGKTIIIIYIDCLNNSLCNFFKRKIVFVYVMLNRKKLSFFPILRAKIINSSLYYRTLFQLSMVYAATCYVLCWLFVFSMGLTLSVVRFILFCYIIIFFWIWNNVFVQCRISVIYWPSYIHHVIIEKRHFCITLTAILNVYRRKKF